MKILKAMIIPAVAVVAVAGIVLGQSARSDCPGKIVCPETGQLICRDKCPTVDPSRPDCPGRIVCPISGKLVCRDRCPLEMQAADSGTSQEKVPPCCARKG